MQDDEIAQQQAQVSAPATDTPARHGGSSAQQGIIGEIHRVRFDRREGHGQDPAQDGAPSASLVRAAAPRLHERLAAEALAADRVVVSPAPAQPAGGASSETVQTHTRRWNVVTLAWEPIDCAEPAVSDRGCVVSGALPPGVRLTHTYPPQPAGECGHATSHRYWTKTGEWCHNCYAHARQVLG